MKKIITLILTLFCVVGASSQTIESLQEDIRRAEAEIAQTNELLDKTRADQQVNQREIQLIKSRIDNRKKVIASLTSQMALINKKIKGNNTNIDKMGGELKDLKADYSKMIYSAYKNYKLNNYLLFLFSASDFNDITRRIFYIRRYNSMREEQAQKISSTTQELSKEVSSLEAQSKQLEQTKQSRNKELASLSEDQKQYDATLSKLKTQENNLSATIRASQQQVEMLQNQIERIIAEQMKKDQNTEYSDEYKAQFKMLSGQFDSNKGRLPIPVRNGIIIDHYGRHQHPTQSGLTVDNKGVNYAAARNADIQSVFDGEVTNVFFFQGLNNSVMVRHGSYLTVYSNLQTVAVKTGDTVKAGQLLGRLSSSDDSNDHVLHFEIWHETTNLNPEDWIKK
ncbi:MAG: peptidoglycan DD-metalloendopeptidase family protein [Rikenellaceae bacterium]